MISRLALAAVLLHSLSAQVPPAFEVATIKPSDPRGGVVAAQRFSARRFEGTGSLHAFIKLAYGIQDFQISGGPKWVTADTFDISAQADQAVSAAQMKLIG
jgi:uncharacterized protein (TIGR03435 family)